MSLCLGSAAAKKLPINHEEINKHLLFPDPQLLGLKSACRQS